MIRHLKYIIISLIFTGCFLGDETIPDQKIWTYRQPNEVGFVNSDLLDLNNIIKAQLFENITGLLIIKDGSVVFEDYYQGNNREKLLETGRFSSLFASIGVGLLIRDGYIIDTQSPIMDYLPEYSQYFESDPLKQQITFEDLLTQRSGLIWNEIVISYQSTENNLNQMQESDDWVEFVLSQEIEAIPGVRTSYNSGTSMIISKIIENITGSSAEDYLVENLFKPLEITQYQWQPAKGASTNLSTGLYISLMDMAKIGYLYLNGGFWQGRSILPGSFVRNSTRGDNIVTENVNYASNWWFFSDEYSWTQQLLEENDLFYFPNENGTELYVIPHLNMVVAISAQNFFYGFNNPSLNLLFNVINSLESKNVF